MQCMGSWSGRAAAYIWWTQLDGCAATGYTITMKAGVWALHDTHALMHVDVATQ